MKLLIIDEGYPSPSVLYGDVFVHIRVKEYAKLHECLVASTLHKEDYSHEGINVKAIRDTVALNNLIHVFKPDMILVHFALKDIIRDVLLPTVLPIIVWVHGYEVLGWYRRLFNMKVKDFYPRNFFRMLLNNIRQLIYFRMLISKGNNSDRICFIFVSNWMKKIASIDTFSNIKNFDVIPNPIDPSIFPYKEKSVELRKHILMIRTWETKKYATDIAVSCILLLQKYPCFKELKFSIYGKGKFWKPYTDKIKHIKNVKLFNSFLPHCDIPGVHAEAGLYLTPTRQDSQGVSMCEAMCSGLVPLTSNNTAIPEFVKNNESGYLTKSAKELADRIQFLYDNPEKFADLSKNAAVSIRNKASIEHVVQKELALFERYCI